MRCRGISLLTNRPSLYCFILLYTAQHCATLLYSALYTLLCSSLICPLSALLWSALLYSDLPCSTLICPALLWSALLYSARLCSLLLYTPLYCSILLCSPLYYSILLWTALYCTTLLYCTLLYNKIWDCTYRYLYIHTFTTYMTTTIYFKIKITSFITITIQWAWERGNSICHQFERPKRVFDWYVLQLAADSSARLVIRTVAAAARTPTFLFGTHSRSDFSMTMLSVFW